MTFPRLAFPGEGPSKSGTASLVETIAKRKREAMDQLDAWTPEQTLEAALYDLRAGDMDPEALVVVYAVRTDDGNHQVGTFTATGASENSNLFQAGMLHKAAADLLGGDE